MTDGQISKYTSPVSLAPPLVGLCGVWVDLDGLVTVTNRSVWLLQADVGAEDNR